MCFYGEILMKQKKESGFTLIEMLIVVAIIAVIVAIAIPTMSNSLHKAKTAADMANVRAYYAKLQADYMLTGEYDPSVPSESNYPREITYPDGTVVKLQAGWIAATVVEKNHTLMYEEQIIGMWDVERYVNLLMGEIPRLSDDKNGYGPEGKNFIVHVDIPKEVKVAFDKLSKVYSVREANPLYASITE